MREPEIVLLDDAEALFNHAAEEIAHFAGEAICMHGEFRLALSGGSTPAAVYELLASEFHLSVDWSEVQFYWGDERCVPPGDKLSNYAMAQRTMLSKLELKPEQIHRIKGELGPADAARAYEQDLRESFGIDEGEFPRFNLILLGLGDNRHTLSLFPGHDKAIHEADRMVIPVEVEAEPPRRITFTPAVANNAERLMFIVSGAAKAEAVRDVLEGPRDPSKFPAQIINPHDGDVIWLLDKPAASLLSRR